MLARRNVVLLLATVGICAFDWSTRPQPAEVREVLPLFPLMEAAEPSRIEISDPQGGAVELVVVEGDELARAPGAPWRVVSKHNWPAQSARVAFLNRLVRNLSTADLLASDAASHGDYGLVESSAARLRVYDGTGGLLADLLQGDPAPGGRATYVRVAGDDRVWRAANLRGRLPSEAEIWMVPTWVPFERAEVVVNAIELSGSEFVEPLRLERAKGSLDLWRKPDGDLASGEAVRSLLESLAALTVGTVQAPGTGDDLLASPNLRVRLERGPDDPEWVGVLGASDLETDEVRGTRTSEDWVVVFPRAAVAPIYSALERL